MDNKLVKDVRAAADNLVAVARNFKTPLDTSEFERALKALLSEVRSDEKNEAPEKPKIELPQGKPAGDGNRPPTDK